MSPQCFDIVPALEETLALPVVLTRLPRSPPVGGGALADTFWVRRLITKEGWDLASSAGAFGWGRLVAVGVLESIDNAYP